MNKTTLIILALLAAIAYQPLGDIAADLWAALSEFSAAISGGFDRSTQ